MNDERITMMDERPKATPQGSGSWLTKRELLFFLVGLGLTALVVAVLGTVNGVGVNDLRDKLRGKGEGAQDVVGEEGNDSSAFGEQAEEDSGYEQFAEELPGGAYGEDVSGETSTSGEDTSGDLSMLETSVPSCAKDLGQAESVFMFMVSHSGTTSLILEAASHDMLGNFTNTLDMEPLVGCRHDLDCEKSKTTEIFNKAKEANKIGILKYNGVTMHSNTDTWFDYFHKELEKPPHFMLMFRNNVFKRAVGRYPFNYLDYDSHFGGLMPGEESRCATGDLCTFEVDPQNLACEMKRTVIINEKMRKIASTMSGPENCLLEIHYEDYLYHQKETMFMVEDFLQIPRGGTTAGREKATSDNMCDVIENYAEVCAAFNECTQWSWMINDEKNGCLCENFEYESLGGDDENPLCSLEHQPGERWYCVVDKPAS